jgi:cytochrome P450
MLRDERFWDNPEEFKPERFLQGLKEGQVDPKSLIFGYGRRLATQLHQSMGCGANSEDQDLPWTGSC